MSRHIEVGDFIRNSSFPSGPPSGAQEVVMADLSHILAHRGRGTVWVTSNGRIHFFDNRPDEEFLTTGDQLRWGGNSSDLTRGGGTPAAITIAAAERETTDLFIGYETPENVKRVWIPASGIIEWDGQRPGTAYRAIPSPVLYSNNARVGAFSWGSSTDTVASADRPGINDRVVYREFPDQAITIATNGAVTLPDTIHAMISIGDRLDVDGTEYIVSLSTGSATTIATAPSDELTHTGFNLIRAGRWVSNFNIRWVGFKTSDWEVWADGLFCGDNGSVLNPVTFWPVIKDVTDGTNVYLVDEAGFEHDWESVSANDEWSIGTYKPRVQRVKATSTITSFWAVYQG